MPGDFRLKRRSALWNSSKLAVNSSEGEESTPEESLLAFLRADTFKRVKAKDIGPTNFAFGFGGQRARKRDVKKMSQNGDDDDDDDDCKHGANSKKRRRATIESSDKPDEGDDDDENDDEMEIYVEVTDEEEGEGEEEEEGKKEEEEVEEEEEDPRSKHELLQHIKDMTLTIDELTLKLQCEKSRRYMQFRKR